LKTTTFTKILDQATTPYTIVDDEIPVKEQVVDIDKMKIVTPQIISSRIINPEPAYLITNYGIQMICYQFFQKDSNLANYEELFSSHNSAFVPFAQIQNTVLKNTV
jgi:hypothetical protein